MRSLVLAACLAFAPLAALAEGDPITDFAESDAEMNAAMAEAQRTLPQFLAVAVDDEGYSVGRALVKVAFDVEGYGAEIIWIGPFGWDGGTNMIGALANEPNYMGDLRAGDVVEFTTDMVRDWSWMDDRGTLWGNYTTRVMVPYLPQDQAKSVSAMLSVNPIPGDW